MKNHIIILTVVSALAAGCATTPTSTTPTSTTATSTTRTYPKVESGTPSCVLKLENQMSTGMLAQFETPTPSLLTVTVDGFTPPGQRHSVTQGSYLPKGTIELPLPAGDHQFENGARLAGNTVYRFRPVAFRFSTVAGKTYTIRFKVAGSMVKFGYTIEYEGWTDEEKAQWPHENYVANPVFR